MAPKKNDENTVKKAPKKRVVKLKPEKPKLKTPTVLRIPVKPLDPGKAPRVKRHLLPEEKLELANEVAFAALLSPKSPKVSVKQVEESVEPVLIEKKPAKGKCKPSVESNTVPKKRVRKKITEGINNDTPKEEPESMSITAEDLGTKTLKKKAKAVTKKSSTDIKDVKPKRKPKLIRTNNKKDTPAGNLETPSANLETSSAKLNTPSSAKLETVPKVIPVVDSQDAKKIEANVSNVATRRSARKKAVPQKLTITHQLKAKPKVLNPDQAGEVKSRKLSHASTNSNLSWTQDISTSSTTTCVTVTSNETLIRIDKKLPVVQMVKIKDPVPKHESSSDSDSSDDSSSSSSSDSRSSVSRSWAVELPGCRSPVLSVSATVSPARESPQLSQDTAQKLDIDRISAAIDLMTSSLLNFDAEMSQQITLPAGDCAVPPAIYDALKYECVVITQCRKLKRILSDIAPVEFARPAPPKPCPRVREETRPTAACDDSPDDFTSDRVKFAPFDQSADDDDALSLFAESITGIESSRYSTPSILSKPPEEYVPEPIAPRPLELHRYRPTRIEVNAKRAICEKQSADSTSVKDASAIAEVKAIEREPSEKWNDVEPTVAPRPEFVAPAPLAPVASVPSSRAHVSLTNVTPVLPNRSVIFRGICFFNLASHCKFQPCRFNHLEPDEIELQKRACPLTDEVFIRELALVTSYTSLRRRIAPALLAECLRRGLTRCLVETAGLCEEPVSQSALETALLYLNTAGLTHVEDLVNNTIGDAMIRALADTQNFSRFRAIFAELASASARSVPLDVATKILERVSILPADEKLARAMLALALRAPRAIFLDESMAKFESRLAGLGGDIHKEFVAASRLPELGHSDNVDQERYTSPDTTHYDSLNSPLEQSIVRTVDFNRSLTNTTISATAQTKLAQVTGYHNWRNGQTFQRRSGPRPNKRLRPNNSSTPILDLMQKRTVVKRPITVTYGAKQKNYQRWSGSDY